MTMKIIPMRVGTRLIPDDDQLSYSWANGQGALAIREQT